MKKPCKQCNRWYSPQNERHHYCSQSCRQKAFIQRKKSRAGQVVNLNPENQTASEMRGILQADMKSSFADVVPATEDQHKNSSQSSVAQEITEPIVNVAINQTKNQLNIHSGDTSILDETS